MVQNVWHGQTAWWDQLVSQLQPLHAIVEKQDQKHVAPAEGAGSCLVNV